MLLLDAPDAVFIADTWPALDPRQAPDSDSKEDTFNVQVAGFHLASTSSSSQSVALVDVLPNTLGPADTPRNCKCPKRLRNRRRDPVLHRDATLVAESPRKFAGVHNNMALW